MLEVNGPGYNLTRRLISAVHDLGQQTMSHASDVAAYTQAIETGIDGIQHTPMDGNLTAALIQQIKSNKQFVTPTMTIFAYGLDPPNPTFLNLLGGKSKPGNNTWYNVVHNVRAHVSRRHTFASWHRFCGSNRTKRYVGFRGYVA
jgi:hypothetical protein